MMVCQRCGVDFDGSDYLPGSPCPDCQDWETAPEYGWLTAPALRRRQQAEYVRVRSAQVTMLHAKGYNDKVIADVLGAPTNSVHDWRTGLNLPLNSRASIDIDPVADDKRAKMLRSVPDREVTKTEQRSAHAAWRLDHGWPELRAYWQQRDMEEAYLGG